ncbi:MAG TPA: patatin-like phospholipase family protein [Gammaproteobacteria bacterium]|nr:patatin-like phospholipase family protein [Gammaproteobacteria bacterium]
MLRTLLHIGLAGLLAGGCASLERYPDNPRLENFDNQPEMVGLRDQGDGDILLIVTFSGGGTRAAALAYGVLEALEDTPLAAGNGPRTMLDEIDMISSVSGGSITAAYFGLFGKRIFSDFRDAFLERNVTSELTTTLLTPTTLSRISSDTFGSGDVLDEYFSKSLFGTAPVMKLVDGEGPFVQINATDLFKGGQFGFTPAQFALICSDINQFQISRAVAASSAVPMVFAPLTLTNHAGSCDYTPPAWLQNEDDNNSRRDRIASTMNFYLDRSAHPYIHLVDGGLADNLGLRAVMDYIVIEGGLWNTLQRFGLEDVKHIVLLSVNATALLPSKWEQSDKTPPSAVILDAATTTPLANYNFETLEYLRNNLAGYHSEIKQHRCLGGMKCTAPELYLIELRIDEIPDVQLRTRLVSVPTDFSLPVDVVNDLVNAGHLLLNSNQEYRRLLQGVRGAPATTHGQKPRPDVVH